MYILAFETSCDDTSVAILQDSQVLALSTRTQLEHDETGGVVPEVAARSHANAIFPCLEDVFYQSGITLDKIDIIACTEKPGLMPSLITGLTVARTLSLDYKKPLILIDHIEAHMFANLLERSPDDFLFPNIVLTVSGGHTEIYLWKSFFEFEILGQTRDDAAGECFDKVGKMLGLGFPAGAKIAMLAQKFRDEASEDVKSKEKERFPRSLLEDDSLDFSFSGMKSAIKRYIDSIGQFDESDIMRISYATEEAITDVLVEKLARAQKTHKVQMLTLAGGVSANTVLQEKIKKISQDLGCKFFSPMKNLYSQDNAAMVGIRAFYEWKKTSNQFGN